MSYQPKTGERCHCRSGIERDNCPSCEGTGWKIDFALIRKRVARNQARQPRRDVLGMKTQMIEILQQRDGTWTVSGLTLEQASLSETAPELLEALNQAYCDLTVLHVGDSGEWKTSDKAKRIRSAIAKAEGREA